MTLCHLSSDFLASTCTAVNKVMTGKTDPRHHSVWKGQWLTLLQVPLPSSQEMKRWQSQSCDCLRRPAGLHTHNWRVHIYLFNYLVGRNTTHCSIFTYCMCCADKRRKRLLDVFPSEWPFSLCKILESTFVLMKKYFRFIISPFPSFVV